MQVKIYGPRVHEYLPQISLYPYSKNITFADIKKVFKFNAISVGAYGFGRAGCLFAGGTVMDCDIVSVLRQPQCDGFPYTNTCARD